MKSFKVISTSIIIFLALSPGLCAASWALEGQIWNSPYDPREVFISQLSVTLEPLEHLQASASLPFQYTRDSQEQELQLLHPSLMVVWSIPWGDAHSASIKAAYQLQPDRLQLEGGILLLFDPLALRASLSYQGRTFTLQGAVVFAVNERWALGAHLHYTKSSVLTYEVIHTSRRDKQRHLSFSHNIDGSLQCLGFKIVF